MQIDLLVFLHCFAVANFNFIYASIVHVIERLLNARAPKISWGPFLTSPQGANFPKGQTLTPGAKLSHRGDLCPLGGKLSLGGAILCSPLYSSKL
jgi:hypothetical protein